MKLLRSSAFFFLLPLTNSLRLRWLFTFNNRRGLNLFLDDTYRREHEVARSQNLNRFRDNDVGDVQYIVNIEIRNIDIDHIGNLARVAADLELANDLLEHTLFFFHAERFAF